jgi:predicted porin
MRKSNIVSLLAAAALVPLGAQADVTLYGKIYAEMGVETFGSGATQSEYSTLDDAQNLGRLGVKFSQDIDEGLQVFGQYEFSLNAPDSTNDFTMREAFVGIRGKTTSFAMGRFDGAYKTTGGVNWDPFAYTSLQLAGTGGQAGTNFGNWGFIDHAMQVQTKYAQGDVRFDATLQYGADAAPTTVTTPKDSFLAGVTVGFGGLDVIYGFAHNAGNGATNQKFGVKVGAGEAAFMIQVENVDQGGYDPVGEGQFMTGIITYAVGNWLWVLEIAEYNTDYTDLAALPTPITGANSSLFTVGGRYYLAKNAWLVFGVRNTDSENDLVDSSATVGGIRFDF